MAYHKQNNGSYTKQSYILLFNDVIRCGKRKKKDNHYFLSNLSEYFSEGKAEWTVFHRVPDVKHTQK